MMRFQLDDRAKIKRQRTEQAIALAMQSRWEEAARVNRSILELFPNDVDAYNRLGKAVTELGRYNEARWAYAKALEIDPNNAIAKKNLTRLEQLAEVDVIPVEVPDKVDPRIFIQETGKTGFAYLYHLAPREALARMNAGDQVELRADGRALSVMNVRGEYLGLVEPRLAQRLINLMRSGNQYAAAITNLDENQVRIIIKETYQHPSQVGRVSFPSKGPEPFRSYIRESLLRYEEEEEEEALEEGEAPPEWEGEAEHLPEEGEPLEEETPPAEKAEEFDTWGKP